MSLTNKKEDLCPYLGTQARNVQRAALPGVIDRIINTLDDPECFAHIGNEPIHFSTSVRDMIEKLRNILFPGYFSNEKMDSVNHTYHLGREITLLYDILSKQIIHVLRHDCLRFDKVCLECERRGNEAAFAVIEQIPVLRRKLAADVRAAYDGDPAAKSHDEIIFSYPGLYAITVHRIANILHQLDIPQLPRIMTELAHSLTGIDIHPGATIGERFVIDHGTGVVIGETSVIGENVRIYQNVTIGALSLPRDAGEKLRWVKRHPTIEDDVIIYSGATVLGGDTTIGARSVVGGNVWLTHSIPADTKIFMEEPRLIIQQQPKETVSEGD
ncbi:serine O-acetyltransferase [Desulfobacter curvatus]|uniref:serine O-acetyltransferase n=1 Tax=Desulfobacter curvatus TaxID=2290 RepID=UPI0003627C3B|nr:serine acetyltransferase [Desulfobacter curvatus]